MTLQPWQFLRAQPGLISRKASLGLRTLFAGAKEAFKHWMGIERTGVTEALPGYVKNPST